MDVSLDEYIRQNNIQNPFPKMERFDETENVSTKFDRYDKDDLNDDDDDEMDTEEMPKLVPASVFNNKIQCNGIKIRQSVHERLGNRNSDDTDHESINTKTLKPFQRNFRYGNKRLNNRRYSVQHRLNKNFVNPAIVARNNLSVNAINSFMESAVNNMSNKSTGGNCNLLNVLASKMIDAIGIEKDPKLGDEPKYNMNVQKEISCMQGRQLFYTCPGASVVSFDGPGVSTPLKVVQNNTGISLNQRFA